MMINRSINAINPFPSNVVNSETFVNDIVIITKTGTENFNGYFLAQLSRSQNTRAQRIPIKRIPGNPNPPIPSIAKKLAFAFVSPYLPVIP